MKKTLIFCLVILLAVTTGVASVAPYAWIISAFPRSQNPFIRSREGSVAPENILYKCGWSPLEGVRLRSRVTTLAPLK